MTSKKKGQEDVEETTLAVGKAFSLTPTNLDQAFKLAELIANSDLAPKDFKGKAGNCLIAMQMGMEVGLAPMQAIQNIAVINGRPTVWGDAAMALVLASPICEYVREEWDEKTQTWTVRGKRKTDPNEGVYTFSMADADRAGLSKKEGTWRSYPKRMIQMRARAFLLRDKFTDVLKGLSIREEVSDYVETVADKAPAIQMPKAQPTELAPVVKSADGQPMVAGELSYFLKELTRLGADMEEVARFVKDKFAADSLTILSRAQAKQVLTAWTDEPVAEPVK